MTLEVNKNDEKSTAKRHSSGHTISSRCKAIRTRFKSRLMVPAIPAKAG